MKNKISTYFLLCSFISPMCFGGAGGDVSGGANIISDESNPWFLGSEPISYCVEVAPDFPIPKNQVSAIISESFQKWKTVFTKYRLSEEPLPGVFYDGVERGLTTDAIELGKCSDPEHQIVFKIGVVDESIQKYFETRNNRTVGFSYRSGYDHKTFRTGGMVWIAPAGWIGDINPYGYSLSYFPNWTPNRLSFILLHEIGHVFGVPHLPETVMDEDAYEHLFWGEPVPEIESPSNVLLPRNSEALAHDKTDSKTGYLLLSLFGHKDKNDPWVETAYKFECRPPQKGVVCLGIDVRTKSGKLYQARAEEILFDDNAFTQAPHSRHEKGGKQYLYFYSDNYTVKRPQAGGVSATYDSHGWVIADFGNKYFTSVGDIRIGEKVRHYTLNSKGSYWLTVWSDSKIDLSISLQGFK